MWYAFKKHYLKTNNSTIICINSSYLKINKNHSDILKSHEMINVNINDVFKIIKEEKEYYLVDKNKIINYKINEKLNEKIDINLVYYNLTSNFGDELSLFITQSLINKNKYNLVSNKKNININIIVIGSYIHMAKNNYYIFGSGVRMIESSKNEHNYTNLQVNAVRGPLTKKYLEDKNIHVPNIYGDPGLLLPIFYEPLIIKSIQNKIGLIPHKSNYDKYINNYDTNMFYLINPMDNWKKVINSIFSCKYIISSSLHGLICSDAYNKPNIWLDEYKLQEGDFKFKDYFQSQDRPYLKISNINDFDDRLLYKDGNKINLELLIKQFPFK